MRQLRLKNFWLTLGWLLLAAIVYVSLTPAPPDPDFEINDKVLHFAMYFILTAWFAQLFAPGKHLVVYALCFFVMGVVLEFGQGLTDERSTSLFDALANGAGIAAGLLLALTPLALTLKHFERIVLRQ